MMGQVDFAYGVVADAVGLPLDVSIYADRAAVRVELAEDVAAAGLTLRECGLLELLAEGELRVLGEAVLLDCPQLDGAGMAALTRLDMRAARSGAMLVVSTTVEALDAVFGCCSQSRPQILVDARRADRIIALGQVIARGSHDRLHELSETDRMTLLRLTEQVNTIAEKLERLGDPENGGVRSAGLAFRFDEQAGGTLRSPKDALGDKLVRPARPPLPDPRLVRRIIQQRQARARFFDGDLFADPAWDMLLDLTAARVEHTRVSVTSLCIASGVPPTTALRWISQMTDGGLLERVEDDCDRRRAFIQLTDKAVDAMARYFAEIGKGSTGVV